MTLTLPLVLVFSFALLGVATIWLRVRELRHRWPRSFPRTRPR